MTELERATQAYCQEHNDDCADAIGDECPFIVEAFKAGAEWQLDHPTSDYAWKIYNFIWDYKYGKFGENLTLQQAIDKYFEK